MTQIELQYIHRALAQLEQPLSLEDRIKILRTMSQLLAMSAARLEELEAA